MKLHLLLTTFILSCLLCLTSYVSLAQSWVWAKGEGDIGNDVANSVTTDTYGNTYITGNIAGKADFSGTIYQGNGIYEMYIAKYDPAGNLLWVKLAGGADNDQGNCIRWNKGFLYVCGGFSDTAFFESTALISKGESDAFVAKYDDSGNLLWVKPASGTGLDYATSLDIDNGGNIFVAGTYESAITLGTTNLTTTSFYGESFYAKYDGGGNVVWAKSTSGNNPNLITGIALDYHDALYLTGYFGGSFKVSAGTVNTSSASYDIFLAKVEQSDGSLDWMKRAGSTYEDGAHGVCCDKDGYPSIIGYFAGTAYFDNNSVTYSDYNDVFVARYDPSGNNLWVRSGTGNKLDVGFAIACDETGNLFATGMFQNIIYFNGNVLTTPDILDRDVFLISYDKNGNIRWLTKAGGEDTDCGLSVAVNNNGTISISGYYLHTCFFGNLQIDYASGNDLFVAKYDPPIVNAVDEVNDDLNVSVYPNPTNADCRLRIADLNTRNATFNISNSLGELLYKGELTSCSLMPTANWVSGVYFIEISSTEKTKMLKLIKQ